MAQNICQSIGNDSLALLSNGYITGPNSGGGTCTGLNVHTETKWIDITGADSLFINTFQHRLYDFSKIYDQNNNLIWSWLGENGSPTWYFKSHSLFVEGNDSVRIEFKQGFNDPFCNGYLQIVGMHCKGCQLSVNTQPTNQTSNINNNAQFVVSSSDTNATYQWQTDLGVGFQNLTNSGQYTDVTNDVLTISNVTLSNNNQQFRCIISSGTCSDTSEVAILTVNNNVGMNEISQENLFTVFPNPAQSQINVKADSKLIGAGYSIYDNTGRIVLTGKLNAQNTTIELNNLSGGIYLFSVGENMKQSFKVIKE
jgi:hypothetical protein